MSPIQEATSPTRDAPAPRWKSAVILLVTCGLYVALLLYIDRGNGIFMRLAELGRPLAVCSALVLLSFGLRYQRWRMALKAQGFAAIRWAPGLCAYLAGFSFTVSPGKAGELLRIRYFGRMAVPPTVVLTTFIYERGLDLVVLTLLGLGAAWLVPAFVPLAFAVLGFLVLLFLAGRWPPLNATLYTIASRLPGSRVRRLAHFLLDGVSQAGPLLRPRVVIPGAAIGTLAWLFTAAAFAYLCHAIGIPLAWSHALGIYPLAMLAGAASLVPGGVGTTEAAIVLMLGALGAPVEVSLAVAVGIRLVTLWLAIAVGMVAMAGLEVFGTRGNEY
ncbi:flippase-like domain-containing protein [Stenotrophomonas sp. ISL-67]|uniref:lysylphosphatidylglycerol synthase transmembrane domain-containing protein n=1 Tax=Stenotrophomonas sp. ISL-67 TaxID=2819171 RepID=UPI001BE78F2A|nr:lysylphosphatidylglycerol synthase transmembrane domain-containing protein [Stenotrophomonas sp. ISL-67]MBT2768138.1 flippase-like domain-containing protein [Stenotrophomonas sp. ISL-67]